MFNKSLLRGSYRSAIFLLLICLVLPLTTGAMANPALAAPEEPPYQGVPTTDFQTRLAKAMEQRQAEGLPIPEITFVSQSANVQRFGVMTKMGAQDAASEATTAPAKTIIYFEGPEEAGYAEWPAMQITGQLAGDKGAAIDTGDFTELYRANMQKQQPDFWQQVEFGQEARRYSISETTELASTAEKSLLAANRLAPQALSTTGDILMGFTYTGPQINHTIEYSLEGCIDTLFWGELCYEAFYLKAGFELNWGLGLRLPAAATLTGPAQVEQGSDALFQTSLVAANWGEEQYLQYGVKHHEGNEFVFEYGFFAGVELRIGGNDHCPLPIPFICNVSFAGKGSESFSMPFGAGTSFPIPPIDIPIYEIGKDYLSFSTSFTLKPTITSSVITADWHVLAGSDCTSAGGTITYTSPGVPVTFGPVSACNLDNDASTNQMQIQVDNFRYYFSDFGIVFGAKLSVSVAEIFTRDFPADIYTLNLGNIFSHVGLPTPYVGDHVGCSIEGLNPFYCVRAGPPNILTLAVTTTDETPPVTHMDLDGTAGKRGWYISDLTFSLGAEDPCGSGVAKSEYSLDQTTWIPYTGPVTIVTEGLNTVSYRSTDKAGNQEALKHQNAPIDRTPPVITGAPTTQPNAFGWWNQDVIVHFEASDSVSGIYSVTPDTTISSEGTGLSVTGTAEDTAGNTAQTTVSGINLDKTPPVVSITSPLPGEYEVTASFSLAWTAEDALSGLDTLTGTLDGVPVTNGQPLDLIFMAAGSHTLAVTARDKAGNATTQSVDFFIPMDLNRLIASTDYMCQMGWIDSKGICNSLQVKLNAASKAADKGKCDTAANALNAFIQESEAQRGKAITEPVADALKTNAQYVMDHLGCSTSQ